jgi:hypothetical protein
MIESETGKLTRRGLIIGVVILILAMFTVVQGTYYTHESRKKSACQAQYNADFSKALRLRAQWSSEDRAAEIQLWKNFLAAKPGEGRAILQKYLDSVARTDKLRAENPLPKLEDRDC